MRAIASQAPNASITQSAVNVSLSTVAHVDVDFGNGSYALDAFSLNIVVAASADIHVNASKASGALALIGKLTLHSVNVTLGSSAVGKFNAAALDTTVALAFKLLAPIVNQKLANGIVLPTFNVSGFSLRNPQVAYKNLFLLIGLDFNYNATQAIK